MYTELHFVFQFWDWWEATSNSLERRGMAAIQTLGYSEIFFNIFIDYAITVVPFPPPHSTPSCPTPPSQTPPYSSCPWVILISSLTSTFSTLFLPSLSIFHLSSMLLILCTFPPLSTSLSPIDNPPCDLHLYGSVPVLVVCLVFFCFGFRCGCL